MPVDITRWRAEIELFYNASKNSFMKPMSFQSFFSNYNFYHILPILFYLLAMWILKDFNYFLISESFSNSLFSFYLNSITNIIVISVNYMCYVTIKRHFNFILKLLVFVNIFYVFISYFLWICGDIEKNPGPNDWHNLSVCHWNLNSIAAHNFSKLSALQAYNSTHNFDIICLSETFLDSSYSSQDEALVLKGYKFIRADNPSNTKRGGVCIYHKEYLPIKILNISQLLECLVCEFKYKDEKCFIVTLYRSPSQTDHEFETFMLKFERLVYIILLASTLTYF